MELTEVVQLAQRGDREAASELYARFHRAVHAVVLTRVRYGDAADLVQDVFVTALRKITTVEDPAAFAGWLMTIARNTATDHARRHAREKTDSLDDSFVDPARAENITPTADAARVLRALRGLPEAYQETLLMRLLEQMTGPEIAERTGLTAGSVRVNLHRGMELLRAALAMTEAA
jgi:RNA polymerase sigma-70 factor, ECF subfamily